MERIEVSTVTKQFKRTFCESRLNELGKAVRFCLRERTVTPFRLVMGLINVMSTPKIETIADVQRAFNALCETDVQYKPFHNQLSKRQFPILMREVCCRVLYELACEVLRFGPDSPFAQFKHITIQDGTSYAIKPSLKGVWPGRFTATNPAAVELHVSLDLLTEIGEAQVEQCEKLLGESLGLKPRQYKGWKTCAQHEVFDRYSQSGESSDAKACKAALLDRCGKDLDAATQAGTLSPEQRDFVECCSADSLGPGSDSDRCPMIDDGFARGPCLDQDVCVNRLTTEWIRCDAAQ